MRKQVLSFLALGLLMGSVGCTPTIKVETPQQPIEINLNVKIEHEILIKVEKDLEDLFETEADIF